MNKTLYLKFILAYAIFGVFAFMFTSVFIQRLTEKHVYAEKAESLEREATLIANDYASGLYSNETSLSTVKRQLDAVQTYLDAVIWIVNPSGLIVLDSSSPVDVENPRYVVGFDPSITAATGTGYSVGKFFNSFADDRLSVLTPITNGYSVRGYVIVHYPVSGLNESIGALMEIGYVQLLMIFLLSLIVLIFFTEIVYLPLKKITKATERYAAGDMHYELSVESNDEMGYLAASLSYMAGEIARTEDDQKKFIANVSHDFRSPLTSIKGYLEAMIDGTIPPEAHDKYLKIVLSETDRLRGLTNSLLELNNLETGGMLLNISDFDINTVIRSVAETFGGRCREKGLVLDLVLTGEDLNVKADRGKIQQVLYNLTDNAIKFSNQGGTIKIETTVKGRKVFSSVKDSGIGIPAKDINQIWERFYKTDLSRGKDKKGTGLGLSITREIIKAHNENINVISTEGVGTEFVFSLPLSEEQSDDE
ncbi:MAG: HAMP domain-containing histidine kinase [Lachnospiraceae bacterium]|nr:HAMP domain-containing histidine kinase [Lachnospiraceae bacterium]